MNKSASLSIRVRLYKGVLVLESYSLYRFVSFDISRYHRWVKKNVLEKGVENIDYFNNRPSHIDENKRGKVRLLISIDFAEILCLQFGTERGKNFRLELLRYKYDFLNGKFDVDPIE